MTTLTRGQAFNALFLYRVLTTGARRGFQTSRCLRMDWSWRGVDAERGALRLAFAVARLRGDRLDFGPPREPDGTGAGIRPSARERAAILAAVDGDRQARAMPRPYG